MGSLATRSSATLTGDLNVWVNVLSESESLSEVFLPVLLTGLPSDSLAEGVSEWPWSASFICLRTRSTVEESEEFSRSCHGVLPPWADGWYGRQEEGWLVMG